MDSRYCVTPEETLDGPALEAAVAGVAAALTERGVVPGQRVMLAGGNTLDLLLTMLALMHLDASVVLFGERQPEESYRRAARLSQAGLLVAGEPRDIGIECVTFGELTGGPRTDATGPLAFDAWRKRQDALITWSSGSLGPPKGVVRSGTTLFELIAATRSRMGYRADDVLLPLVPVTHFYGMTLALLWWETGCGLVLPPLDRFDRAMRFGVEADATVVDATPSTYYSLLNLVSRAPELRSSLDRVRLWCSGGAPLGSTVAGRFEAEFGLPLLDGYGSNEAGNIALANAENPVHCGQPLPGVELRVLGPQGEPLPAGELGEIVLTTPFLMEGYLSEDGGIDPPQRTYRTDDIGLLDEDGNVTVVGRKLAVHRLGHTLYPDAIERRAEACGQPVKIVPLQDPRLGSRLVFVVADPEGRGARYWRREIDSVLAEHERPNRVLVMEEMPLGSTGKPDLNAVREYVERVVATRAARSDGPSPRAGLLPGRREAVEKVLELLKHEPGPVVEVLTEVSVRRAVDLELEAAISTLAGACDEVIGNRPGHVPQMAVFMPSNLLLYSYVMQALVPSLFTERVVVRASGHVAAATRRLHELLAPVHGLPVEIVDMTQRQFVEGPVRDSEVVSFTGTYANAEKVRDSLRREQLFLFFGQGVNPFVLGPDADLDLAVEDLIRIRLLNSGQDCFGPDVCLVPKALLGDFVRALTKRLSEQRFGEYADPEADYGPLWYEDALETAVEYLFKHREFIVDGGRIDFRTRHMQPAVLVRDISQGAAVKEFFSPVFNIVGYHTQEELETVLTSPFFNERAMGAMVYGVDDALVQRLAQKHTVAVDATLLEVDNGNLPFGGRGIRANYASTGGERIAEPLLISKAVADYRGGW